MQREKTPLRVASKKGHCDIAKLLLEKGAEPNAKDYVSYVCILYCTLINNYLQGRSHLSGWLVLTRPISR